ncbi:MAG: hypothetical protein Q8Q35_03075 [Nanoarchaeota archaeon]|nr:hypothetical protein [Nanoarchaeota archaeon]
MEEGEEEDLAQGELKRIDHLVFVTLKYTRTVDVIRTILEKFIDALDRKIEDYFNYLFEKNEITRIPPVALVKMKQMEQVHPDDPKVKDLVDFYVMLKNTFHADYRPREEYRKNVTMVTKDKEVNITMLKEYAEYVKDFVSYVDGLKK